MTASGRRLARCFPILLLAAALAACGAPRPDAPPPPLTGAELADGERVVATFMTVCIARNRADFVAAAAREGFGNLPPAVLSSEVVGRPLTDRDIVLGRHLEQGIQLVFWNDAQLCELVTLGLNPSAVDDAFARTIALGVSRPGNVVIPMPNTALPPHVVRRTERPVRAVVYGVQVRAAIAARLFVLSIGDVPGRGPYTLFMASGVSVRPSEPGPLPTTRQP